MEASLRLGAKPVPETKCFLFQYIGWEKFKSSVSSESRKSQPHPSYSSLAEISVWNRALIVEAWTVRHCRMLQTSGCRGWRATCTVREYKLKGGRRLSTKMDTTLKINCAFNNTAVMFCEVFKCFIHWQKYIELSHVGKT